MSTFIKLLPLELAEIKEFQEPTADIEDGDHVVGDMSEDLKKLWTLWKQSAYRASELKLQLRYGQQNVTKAQTTEAETKAEVLNIIFWIAIHDEFSLWDKESTGVRKGYKVVWSDEAHPGLPPFLRRIIEGL